MLNSPVQFPPRWELENRPISDARILAEIVLPDHAGTYSLAEESSRPSVHSNPDIIVQGPEDLTAPQHSADVHSVRKRSGFRQTVRKALARARTEDTLSNAPEVTNELPDDNLNPDASRPISLIFRRRRSRATLSFVQTHGRVVDTSALQDSVVLMVATNTPLPHTPTVGSGHMGGVQNQHTQRALGTMNAEAADIIAHA